jgi:hypothetical protein
MVAWFMLATVSAVGVPFYLRFLYALYKEAQHSTVCYLVRIHPTENEGSRIESKRGKTLPYRAA